jgi:hypothetical protein
LNNIFEVCEEKLFSDAAAYGNCQLVMYVYDADAHGKVEFEESNRGDL